MSVQVTERFEILINQGYLVDKSVGVSGTYTPTSSSTRLTRFRCESSASSVVTAICLRLRLCTLGLCTDV